MLRAWKITSFLVALAGCSAPPEASHLDATPQARKALGMAARYQPESLSAEAEARVKTSMLERRRLAWRAVEKVLAPATHSGLSGIPEWGTWYAKDDFQRMFHKLYDGLGKERRKLRDGFGAEAIRDVFSWNTRAVDEFPHWPAERYEEWLRTLDTDERRRGAVGMNRTYFSPGVIEHFLWGYKDVDECLPRLKDLPFEWKNPDSANFTACFPHEFHPEAALVKTAWRRRDFGLKIPVYDTDANALHRRLSDVEQGWGIPDREASPNDRDIYALQTESGGTFQLTGLHLMTKELREWLWITLWWSDSPDTDFGEDRPDAITALGGPWKNYKMCVVTGFTADAADDPTLGLTYPSLAQAIAAAQAHTGGASWCSNPYVEQGARNHLSNCIGCHQHGGTPLESQGILTDEATFPGRGSRRVRENFPSDYLWSFAREPERLSGYVHQLIGHYDVHDR